MRRRASSPKLPERPEDRLAPSPNPHMLSECVQTLIAPRLSGMPLLAIPSPTSELRCLDGIGAFAGSSGSEAAGASFKPRQLLTCLAGPPSRTFCSAESAAAAGGLGLLTGGGALGGTRFASSSDAYWEDSSRSSRMPGGGALSTTPVAGAGGGSAAAGAVADGLTGILALVRQLQGNLAGLELDMAQLSGALHRRSSSAHASTLPHRRHHGQH